MGMDLNEIGGARLSQVFTAGDPAVGAWRAEEMGPLLGFQMEAKLADDLGGNSAEMRERVEKLSGSAKPAIQSFSDLLLHPAPPLELLMLVKEFAKAARGEADSHLPPELATVLYFGAIVAALVHLGSRITELDDTSLGAGVKWALNCPWLDPRLRELFQQMRPEREGSRKGQTN